VLFRSTGYLGGRSRLDEPAGVNFEVDYDYFDEVVWPILAHRVAAFEALKVGRAWACLYDLNRLDDNLIIGPWLDGPGRDGLENFYVACGFSGHGLQQAPAVGRTGNVCDDPKNRLGVGGNFDRLQLVRIGSGEDGVVVVIDERLGDGASDAARGAGDDGCFPAL
jgi:hypothetical protein